MSGLARRGYIISKILMLYQGEKLPSSRVRVLNLVAELKGLGLDVVAQCYPKRFEDRLRLLTKLSSYDLIVLQKKLLTRLDFFLLRHFSKKMAFDFDDAIYMRDDNASQSYSRTRLNRFRNIVNKSDVVIAGNPFLAAHAKQYNPRVEVVPSAVPHAGIAIRDWQVRNAKLVIGWVGGGKNLPHLSIVGDALRHLSQRIDFELRVVSNQEFHLEGVAVKNIPWRLESQEQEIAMFDVGIMPIPKTPWSEGKCSYKLLQYMAAGVPVVATDWGFNRTVVKSGTTGFLAENAHEFYSHILAIDANHELARNMGRQGRLLIEKEYSVTAVGKKMAKIFHHLAGSPLP